MVEIFVCISFKLSSCAQDVEIVEKKSTTPDFSIPRDGNRANVKKCLQITSHTILELHIASDI